MPRRLLHIFPSFGIGGVPIRLTRLINAFGNRYHHTIVALDRVFAAADRIDRGLPVELTPIITDKTRPLATFLNTCRALREHKPDLLLTYNWGSIDWAMANRLLRVSRHVHHEDGFGIEEAERQIPRRTHYRRLALARAAKVVVPSHLLEGIARTQWRLGPERIVYIPNGVDLARFAEAADAGLVAKTGDELIIGTVAPLRPEKNLSRLIRVFAAIAKDTSARLVLAGDGSERTKLEALVAALGLGARVTFLGNIADPETVLKAFDIFTISSDTEQMPITILEAMAAGLPIAGTDVGDIKSMISPENRALIVAKEDEAGFGKALQGLLADAARRRVIGTRNRAEVAARFTQEQMFAAYDKIFST